MNLSNNIFIKTERMCLGASREAFCIMGQVSYDIKIYIEIHPNALATEADQNDRRKNRAQSADHHIEHPFPFKWLSALGHFFFDFLHRSLWIPGDR